MGVARLSSQHEEEEGGPSVVEREVDHGHFQEDVGVVVWVGGDLVGGRGEGGRGEGGACLI